MLRRAPGYPFRGPRGIRAMMKGCAIVPAYDAARNVGEVVRTLLRIWPDPNGVFVVDDGSTDGTAEIAEREGARVVRHPFNRGKGAALCTGFRVAYDAGFDVAVTVDADGQHPPEEALRLLLVDAPEEALVLGIRDLVKAGAPRPNQISNRISNYFLSKFARSPLLDTQCGLRRYPLVQTLAVAGRANGYAFEAEIILRAKASSIPIVEEPIHVIYPPEKERISHFDSVRDPARIIVHVLTTLVETRYLSRPPRRNVVSPRSRPHRTSAGSTPGRDASALVP